MSAVIWTAALSEVRGLHAISSCRTSAGAAGLALPPRGCHRPVLRDRRRRSAIGLGRQSPRLMPGSQLRRASHASWSNLRNDKINRSLLCRITKILPEAYQSL